MISAKFCFLVRRLRATQMIMVAVEISLTLVDRFGLGVGCNRPDVTVGLIVGRGCTE